MFSVSRYLATRKEYKALRDQRNGFDWMAGELLRGKLSVDELEERHNACMWERTNFDVGVQDAIREFRKLLPRKMRISRELEPLLDEIESAVVVWSMSGPLRIRNAVVAIRNRVRGL